MLLLFDGGFSNCDGLGSEWWLQKVSILGFEMTYNWVVISGVILSGVFTSFTKCVAVSAIHFFRHDLTAPT